MIAKKILMIIKKNSMMVIGAAILASWIFYVVNNPDLFTASILSLQEQNFITEKWRDIAYKTNSGYVDIFLAKDKETPTQIDFIISFDKNTVSIDPENLSGQGTRTYNNPDKESIIITSTPDQNVDKNQSIIMLPFNGALRDILLSEAVATFANKKDKNLSIWSLNDVITHSK